MRDISISGAKRRNITSVEEWKSELFTEARNQRSSVESLMFTIKYNHKFGRLMRGGIESVRAELLEKVVTYNFCRIIKLSKRSWKKLKVEAKVSIVSPAA